MSWFRTTKPENPGIVAEDNMDEDGFNVSVGDFDENELLDPALLAELEGLTVHEPAAIKFTHHQVSVAQATGDGEDEEPVVEVTDADYNDPSLMAQLAAFDTGAAPEFVQPNLDDESPESQEYDVDLMITRVKEYKTAALTWKKADDIGKAREMLATSKHIQKGIDLLAEGLPLLDFVIPGSPNLIVIPRSPAASPLKPYAKPNTNTAVMSDKAANTPKLTESITPKKAAETTAPVSTKPSEHEPSKEEQSSPGLISHLIDTLSVQISLCNKLSTQYFTSDQKDLALNYHKKKKGLIQDKETLSAMKSLVLNANSLPFRFYYIEHNYSVAQSHLDVPLDQMEVTILSGCAISVAGEEIESGVSFDMGWPFNTVCTLPEGKGDTVMIKGCDPEYAFKKSIKIERTRAFQRFIERKKASFEVFYYSRSLFGMLSSRVVIGKGAIKLDTLLSKCEIHQVIPMMDPSNPRKATGGTVEISIRLRAPLTKADILMVSEKWLQIEFGEQQVKIVSPVAPLPVISPVDVVTPIHTDPVVVMDESDEEYLEQAFLSPENIVSNAVLEHEHAIVLQQILMGSTEELVEQRNGYQLKMDMLVTSIQIGTLDMPGYILQVQTAISKTKSQALDFKRRNKPDLAKQALVRVKLMTAEILTAN